MVMHPNIKEIYMKQTYKTVIISIKEKEKKLIEVFPRERIARKRNFFLGGGEREREVEEWA